MNKAIQYIQAHILEETENTALFYMIIGGFSFATMGAMTHALGQYTDWVLIVVIRMFTTFVLTVSAAFKSGINPFLFTRPLLWFRSIIGSGAMLATFYALIHLPISDVSVITETRPIWVALLAGFVLGETPGRSIWFSIFLGIVGVILIENPHIAQKNYAALIALLASILGSIVMICLRKLRDLDPKVIVTQFSGTATLVGIILLLFFRDLPNIQTLYSWKVILMLAGVGIFGTFGQLSMTKAFSLGQAPTVSTAGLLKVGFSAMYDLVIWGYVFQFSSALGMILILGSTAWLFGSNAIRLGRKSDESQD